MSVVHYPQRIQSVHVESIDGDLCVYDTARQHVHALNHTAAFVWQRCDGLDDADRTGRGPLRRSLDRRRRGGRATDAAGAGRRATAGGAAPRGCAGVAARPAPARGVAAAAVPVVYSIVAPTPAGHPVGARSDADERRAESRQPGHYGGGHADRHQLHCRRHGGSRRRWRRGGQQHRGGQHDVADRQLCHRSGRSRWSAHRDGHNDRRDERLGKPSRSIRRRRRIRRYSTLLAARRPLRCRRVVSILIEAIAPAGGPSDPEGGTGGLGGRAVARGRRRAWHGAHRARLGLGRSLKAGGFNGGGGITGNPSRRRQWCLRDVYQGATPLVIAGGGGGAGRSQFGATGNGGNGGGLTAVNGQDGAPRGLRGRRRLAGRWRHGRLSEPGGSTNGTPGVLGTGGAGGNNAGPAGGGRRRRRLRGAAAVGAGTLPPGSSGGGGGGSSFTAPGATNVIHTQGAGAGAGQVHFLDPRSTQGSAARVDAPRDGARWTKKKKGKKNE